MAAKQIVIRAWGKRDAPCRNCEHRRVGCHSVCEDYKDFRLQNDRTRTEQQKQNREQEAADEVRWRRMP